jgi:peptidoglycan/xylan/chitin deacetylase (PgdA/CDA1 family)
MRRFGLVLGLMAFAMGAAQAQSQEQAEPQVQAVAPAEPQAAAPAEAQPQPKLAAQTPACPGNPDAIGTSRTITVDPSVLPQIGTMQYKSSLPLEDHEVVITFDDGPLPPYTNRILDVLAENCVKVNYFLVGEMARAYPSVVRRIYNAGHVVGTHSLSHPLTFNRMGDGGIERQVDGGIAAVQAALGDPKAVAPFFRVPGLLRNHTVDGFLAMKSLAVWSADEVADDWHHGITPKQIVKLAINRIEAKNHRGVLLLHDIHPATALALPALLKELKAHGYRIVQAVPAGQRPASVPEPLIAKAHEAQGWPRVVKASLKTEPAAAEHAVKTKHARHHVRRHHRHKVAEAGGDDAIEKAVAKKKQKAQTADSGVNVFNIWR